MEKNLVDIKKTAYLSKLKFNEQETEAFEMDMNEIIEFAGKLDNVITDRDVCAEPSNDKLRDDIPGCVLSREEMLENAKSQNGIYVSVPKTVDA